RRQGHRQGPARDIRLRVRAADGAPQQAAQPQRRDHVHHDRDPLVVRLQLAGQGDREVRRRRLQARPAPHAAEAEGALRQGGGLMGELFRGMAAGAGIRVVAVDTTDVVREAVVRQGASRTAGAATGRAMTAAVLLSHVLLKSPRDRVTLRLDGGGPLGRVTAEAGLDHAVRGYAQNPDVELPLRPDGKLDVGGAVGRDGEIRVVRSHAPYGDPCTSSIALTSGEVGEDVATYLAVSEQIASAVLLGVHFTGEGQVDAAGGVIMQALPGVDPNALTLLEANIRDLGQLTAAMRRAPLVKVVEEELCWGLGFELDRK